MNRLDAAVRFLRAELSDGPIPSCTLLARARDAGISEKTLRRALWALGARHRKLRGGRFTPWVWELIFLGKVVCYQDKRLPHRNWRSRLARCRECGVRDVGVRAEWDRAVRVTSSHRQAARV